MNVSSASSSASSIWNLLANRNAHAAKSAAAAGSTASTSSTSVFEAPDGRSQDEAVSATDKRPQGPLPPPSQFDVSMSTSQFAGMGGMPPMGPAPDGQGEDPLASLDSDGNGSVSADEFGLTGASDDVRALFSGIDSNGDGELSTDELGSFRDQMTEALQEAGGPPPGAPPVGPPPGASASGEGSTSRDSDDSSATSTADANDVSTAKLDINSFIQQLAARYASMGADQATGDARLSMMA